MTALSDNALMIRVKDGDLDKMGLLFQRYHRSLFSFLYHMTGRNDLSEDMVQNVFYRMLKYRHSFSGEGEFRTWMYHVARNVLYDSVKQTKMAEYEDVHALADRIPGGASPEWEMERNEDQAMLLRAIASLSPEHREIIVMSRFQELKYSEISDILNISESAIKVRVHRAMGELKKVFTNTPNKSKAHDL